VSEARCTNVGCIGRVRGWAEEGEDGRSFSRDHLQETFLKYEEVWERFGASKEGRIAFAMRRALIERRPGQ
jgi:hypothetical protein